MILKGLFIDSTRNQEHLGNISADEWAKGVKDTLKLLFFTAPCTTSKAILHGIAANGKTVTIVPSTKRGFGPERIGANAGAQPVDFRTASAPGKPTEADDGRMGIGGGSDVVLEFVAQDWEPPGSSPSFKAADEVLLHELVHALRQTAGQEDNTNLLPPSPVMALGSAAVSQLMSGSGPPPTRVTQIYQNLEEFAAILITNIYRSENLRSGLVRDHLGPRPLRGMPQGSAGQPFRDPREETRTLGHPLTNPRNFLTLWRPQVERLFVELSRSGIVQTIASVRCSFNPFFELLQARLR